MNNWILASGWLVAGIAITAALWLSAKWDSERNYRWDVEDKVARLHKQVGSLEDRLETSTDLRHTVERERDQLRAVLDKLPSRKVPRVR